jgi:hypothetical protein
MFQKLLEAEVALNGSSAYTSKLNNVTAYVVMNAAGTKGIAVYVHVASTAKYITLSAATEVKAKTSLNGTEYTGLAGNDGIKVGDTLAKDTVLRVETSTDDPTLIVGASIVKDLGLTREVTVTDNTVIGASDITVDDYTIPTDVLKFDGESVEGYTLTNGTKITLTIRGSIVTKAVITTLKATREITTTANATIGETSTSLKVNTATYTVPTADLKKGTAQVTAGDTLNSVAVVTPYV